MGAGARPRMPLNRPASVAAGQSTNADLPVSESRLDRLPNEPDADVPGLRAFDEESFSEVLTYYGSSSTPQV